MNRYGNNQADPVIDPSPTAIRSLQKQGLSPGSRDVAGFITFPCYLHSGI